MKDDPLENLLMDQAFGELTPDVAWLLDRYLADHPEERERLEECRQTVNLARKTLRLKQAAERPLPVMPDLSRIRRSRWKPVLAGVAACAAGFLLGLASTNMSEIPKGPQVSPPAKVQYKVALPVLPEGSVIDTADGSYEEGGMWSLKAWEKRMKERKHVPQERPTIEWDGIFKPKLNGKSGWNRFHNPQ